MMMAFDREPIGIAGIGVYIPQKHITAAEISMLSGIPSDVIEHKMGISRKPIPGDGDHSCAMGVLAAKQAIESAGVDPRDIDVVIYIGEEYKEYPMWTASIKLQQEVGAVNAWAFDASLRCSTAVMALKVATSLMRSDESIGTVLLAGGYRNGDLVDYTNPRTRFLFNLGAGGGAVVLRRGHSANEVLESHLITDGSFSEDVIIPAGGTIRPLTADTDRKLLCFDVPDPEGMKQRLDKLSMAHFLETIRQALRKSGYSVEDIDYLAMLHMKKSAHDYVLQQLGVSEDKSIYLREYGHIGQFDQFLSLELASAQGKLNDGDIAVLVSAGIGYAWGATVVRWGRNRDANLAVG
jgi:3-oxoacyl-[acyl-carrier-protein] synthase-3